MRITLSARAPGGERATRPSRSRRLALLVPAFAVLAAAAACTVPAPPPYPYWGQYGSAQGVTNEVQARSARLEQYVKDFLDGKVPAAIPDSLIPEGRDKAIKNFYIQRPAEVNPQTQWATRVAHGIDTTKAQGFFPDPHATYLLLPQFLAPFGSKVTITGQFPHARYFSLQPTPSFKAENMRYGYAGEGEVAFVDADIKPDPGSTNPFRVGANRNATNRNYTITCDMAIGDPAVLDQKAWTSPLYRDTDNNHRHCSGFLYRGPWGDPNFKDANGNNNGDKAGLWDVGQVWGRIYGPDKTTDKFGGVPLPKVMYQLPDGRQYFINADFSAFTARVNGIRNLPVQAAGEPPAIWGPGLGWAKQFDIFRQVTEGAVQYYNYPNSYDPTKQRKYVRDLNKGVDGKGEDAPGIARLEPHATGSVHINYLTKGMCLGAGKVYTIQGTLPTTPKTRNGEATMTGGQARYWSITGYATDFDFNDPNFVAGAEITSVADDEIVTDAGGHYILMYGRPQDRPSNATAANGVTWIDWGPMTCQSFTMRWLSIGPEWTFAKAPNNQNANWETDWAAAAYNPAKLNKNNRQGLLGDYHPVVSYMTKAQFQNLGKPNWATIPPY